MAVTGSASAAIGCGSIGYAYDAAGRLVGVSDQTGHTAMYAYDQVGNITAVQNTETPALWVQSLVPARGPVGTTVSITGGCFSSTPADNTVRFGNVPATVTLATTQRLVAVVPPGASSGAITVTRGSATATSPASFTVTDGVTAGPAITEVSPTLVAAGDSITVNGTGYDTEPLNDLVTVNRTRAMVRSASASGLSVEVPQGASSGRLRVTTPYGNVVSGADVFVVPAPYALADVAQTGRVSIGTARTAIVSADAIADPWQPKWLNQ